MSAVAGTAGPAPSIDDGAVAAALDVFASAVATAADLVAACKALAAAATADTRVVDAVVAKGCVPSIVAAVDEHEASEAVAEAACTALWRFAWESDDAAAAIAAAGAVKPVLAALQRHIAFAAVVQAACGVLGRIAFIDQSCADAIVLAGGDRAILAALTAHVSSVDVGDAACGAVQRVAVSSRLSVAACARLAAHMLAAVAAHPTSARVIDAVGSALVGMAWAHKYEGLELAMKAAGCAVAVIRAVSTQSPPFRRERTLCNMREQTWKALRAMVEGVSASTTGARSGSSATASSSTPSTSPGTMSEAADPYDALHAACNALCLADMKRVLAACTKRLHADKRVALVTALVHEKEYDKDSDHDDDEYDDGTDDDRRPRAYRRVLAARMLVERGFLDTPAIAGRAVLGAMGVTECTYAFLRVLVEDAGADLRDEPTCLHHSMDPGTLRLLLDAGADVNARGEKGCTPLINFLAYCEHEYAEKQIPGVIRMLLRHGADASLEDDYGFTALRYIREFAGDFRIPRDTIASVARSAAWHRRRHLLLVVRDRYPAPVVASDGDAEEAAVEGDEDGDFDEDARHNAIAYIAALRSYLGYS